MWQRWGVSEDVLCAGNEKTLQFITDVLEEVTEIFPSKYIHVGGDECPKVRWASCPKCQAKIKELGLKSDAKHTKEQRLQSYIINYAENFLNSKGRQIIGWDEILEGGLAPNATVMSWRGEVGGIEAARQKHQAIMTPNSYLYFDYYQTAEIESEPLAIGGCLPVERVYSYEPIPSSLTPEEASYIIGVQANLWTEYIPTFSHVEYMELPRMAALSEVQWTMPEKKDYVSFLKRLPQLIQVYKQQHYNYAKHVLGVSALYLPDFNEGVMKVVLSTVDNAPIYYTLDGTEPTVNSQLYSDTLKINSTVALKAVAIRDGEPSLLLAKDITFNKATLKPIQMLKPICERYKFKGEQTLVDGMAVKGEVPTVSVSEAVSADKGEAQEIPCTVTTVNVNGQDCEALSYTVTDANGQTATVSYCLVGDDLKYVVTDAAEGRTIVEYRVTSTTVDQNLFNIPADYQILTQAEFEAAQASH